GGVNVHLRSSERETMSSMKIPDKPEWLEETQTYDQSRPDLKQVTDETEAEVRATEVRVKRRDAWRRYWWMPTLLVVVVVFVAGVLTGTSASNDQVDTLLSDQASFNERLASLDQRFEAERASLEAEIEQLEQALAEAPTVGEMQKLQADLDLARAELTEVEEVHAAEVLELQRSNAGLRAHNEELAAQSQASKSEAAQARSDLTRAEAALSAELARMPVRLA